MGQDQPVWRRHDQASPRWTLPNDAQPELEVNGILYVGDEPTGRSFLQLAIESLTQLFNTLRVGLMQADFKKLLNNLCLSMESASGTPAASFT